jgi:branched-chain amino acid transport system permease protein
MYGALLGSYIIGLTTALIRGAPTLIEGIPVLSDIGAVTGTLNVLSELPVAMAFIVLVVVLLVRPSGIAGTEVEA